MKRPVPRTRTGRCNKTSGPPFVAGVTWVDKVGQRPAAYMYVSVAPCVQLGTYPAFEHMHVLGKPQYHNQMNNDAIRK